jgi:STAS domain
MSKNEQQSWRDGCCRSNATACPATPAGSGAVDLDVSWLVPANLSAIDALARLQLAASRCGRRLQLHGADGGLTELVSFVGLGDVVHLCPCCGSSGPRGEVPRGS